MDDNPSTSIKRRLAAILAADIAGYSRLMGEDEAATVRDLKGHQAVVLPLVGRYGGRIIDTAGDGILAEFPSVINATECAVEIQTIMATRNEGVPESRRMRFRIGINLGDVIHDETRIYGDGINVAARLEGIAEPGGICISRQVFDQVSRALKADFQALGPRTLKNIAQPVDVFAIAPAGSRRRTGRDRPPMPSTSRQEIRFCTAPDGVQLAYSMIGQGPPLMKTGNWMTHLEFDLESPIWRHLYRELAKDHTLDPLRRPRQRAVGPDRRRDLVRRLRERSGGGGRRRGGRAVRAARDLPGVRGLDRVRGAPSRAGVASDPLRRLRAGLEQARPQRGREGGGCRHADADARGLGQGEPGLPPAVHLPVHARRDQGAGRLVQRAAADHGLGGDGRADFRRQPARPMSPRCSRG